MQKSLWLLLCVSLLAPARAQQRKNELRLSAGITQTLMRDEQASPLRYHAGVKTVRLGYFHRSNRARFGFELAPSVGSLLPDRFGARTYGDEAYSYTVSSAYYEMDLGVHYLRRVGKANGRSLRLFVGGSLRENFRYADAIANFNWGTNLLGLRAEGLVEWTPGTRHRFTVRAGLPVLAAVTRHTYANFPKSTDEANLSAFFRQGTRLGTVNRLQQLVLEAGYQLRVGKRFSLGGTYGFNGFRYALPRTFRAADQSFALQTGFHF